MRKLGHATIFAGVVKELDADQAQLAEIDENLIRAELSPAERAAHVAARKAVYERLHPETKHGGDRKSESRSQNAYLKSFVADTAKKTGKHHATVARDVKRGKDILDVAALAGTSLDKGAELDALAKLSFSIALVTAAKYRLSRRPSGQQARSEKKRRKMGIDAMAMATTIGTLPEAEHSAQLRKAVIASTVGTAIEWYDFFLYGTAAGLVFGKLYFPNEAPLAGTLAAFGTYFIGFVGRPIGAAIFGHYGDRIGRKATLIATLMCMGLATFAIAFVPTYASIGIWGAILLTVLRMIQGIGVGGEWGGSVLLAMEWSRTQNQRGLIASWPQFGVPCGLLLSNFAILAFSAWAGDDFLTWGWRIPFALSIILVGIGLWIRLGILETPVFQEILDKEKVEKAPVLEVIKKQPKEIILSALLRLSEQAPFYVFTAFVFAYAVGTLKMDRNFILSAVMAAACLSFFTIPLAGHFSDKIGRRNMYLIGVVVMGLFGFLYFGMVDTAIPVLVFIAITVSLIPHDLQYGPQAALIAEAFKPNLRYSGASLGYQLASIIAGGPAPIIATWLFATYHSGYAISVYIAVLAVISFIATALMPDYTGKDISDDAYSED